MNPEQKCTLCNKRIATYGFEYTNKLNQTFMSYICISCWDEVSKMGFTTSKKATEMNPTHRGQGLNDIPEVEK